MRSPASAARARPSQPEARSRPSRPLHVLYIVYWGALEPLGQALVLPAILRLASAGVSLTLVTFEKGPDLADTAAVNRLRAQLKQAGVHWIGLRYHHRPTVPAKAWDTLLACARVITAEMGDWPHVVHGRTYLGGVMGMLVSHLLQRPFIFHNEGFWPDEQVASGIWTATGLPYRAAKRMERMLYRRADAVIALSEVARDVVRSMEGERDAPVEVVPSCVDLERFRPDPRPLPKRGPLNLTYLGSLGGRYRVDQLARFLKAAGEESPGAYLQIYSHSSEEMIRTEFQREAVAPERFSVGYVPHENIPAVLPTHDAGVFFLATGVSARVCSPTKIGEYWACGLPVVTTPQVGDVEAIVRREGVGVVVEDDTPAAYRQAARDLHVLLQDAALGKRCRRAAEKYYSLERGVETQLRLYEALRP